MVYGGGCSVVDVGPHYRGGDDLVRAVCEHVPDGLFFRPATDWRGQPDFPD